MKKTPIRKESSVHKAIEQSKKKEKIHTINNMLLITCIIVSLSTILSLGLGPANEMSCIIKQVNNPTFNEMLIFLAIDGTDKNPYAEEYVCHHFASDLIKNARSMGIQAGYVTLYHKPTGHAIVAFKTTDQGLYFVEPQSDNIITETEMEQMVAENCYLSDPQNPKGIPFNRYSINWFYGE
jgi:hypothetical protein